MVLNKGLCKTCKFRKSCNLVTGMSYTWYCEAFEEQNTTASLTASTEAVEPQEKELPTGLCATCDHINYCSIYKRKNTVLNCEHYQ